MGSRIKQTRNVARGYSKPTIICAKCGKVTAGFQQAFVDGIPGMTLVCRKGTGCAK